MPMSYPSIHQHLEDHGAVLETASDAQLKRAYIAAFKSDLPLGFAKVAELVEKLYIKRDRVVLSLDPKSAEGQEFARLLAPDIPRLVPEEYFDCAFGFYNCCKGVAARTRDGLKLSLREQIESQHPSFVDC
jgi:hypothetical protein